MNKNPVRPRQKHVHLHGHSPLFFDEHTKHVVGWADVWIEYKDGVYRKKAKRNSPKDRTVYLGPCLVNRQDSTDNLAFQRSMIAQAEEDIATGTDHLDDWNRDLGLEVKPFDLKRAQEYLDYLNEELVDMLRIEEELAKGAEFSIDPNDKYEEKNIPEIYTRSPLNRETAEKAIRWYLAKKGLRNVKLIWHRPKYMVQAM